MVSTFSSIRIATPADVPALFRVRTSVRENVMSMAELAELGITPETLPEMLKGEGRGWVVEHQQQVVAFVMADVVDATVFALFVQPDYERQGLGRALMDQAEQWLFSQGCSEIWLVTDSDVTVRANGFYRYLGWQEAGIQDDGQMRFIKRNSEYR